MNRIAYYFFIFAGIMMTLSCGQDPATDQDTLDTDSLRIDTAVGKISSDPAAPPLPPPKISEEKKVITKKAAEKSPFKDLGCCADEVKRDAENCCCKEVLTAYAKMVKANKKDLVKIKTTDPILSFCRNKHKDEFYKIDYPPGSQDEDDGL